MLTIVERVLLLADVDLFAEVPSEELARLASASREDRFGAGEVVYRDGDPGDALHVVGRAFGAFGLLDGRPRHFSATATEPTRLLTVERSAFVDVLSDHVRLAEGVLAALATRVRRFVLESANPSADEEASLG